MRLSRKAQEELEYLQGGGSSISELPAREMVRKGLIVVTRPQPWSNSPYTGLDVTLTKKGRFWPEEPPAMTMLSDLNEDQRKHLAWRLDAKTCCGLLTAAAVARGDHGDMDIVAIFQEYGDRTLRSAQAHARAVEKFKVDEDKRAVINKTLALFSTIQHETKGLTTKQQIAVYKNLMQSLKDSKGLLEIVEQSTASSAS